MPHTPAQPTCDATRHEPPFRIGVGWDRHRLEPVAPAGPGRPLILGGEPFSHPDDLGPVSHSDGDALYHAVTDAILGALALPDIGQLHPNDDPDNLNQDSARFLKTAVAQAARLGWSVGNLDTVVVLEKPKLSPKKDAIRANLASLLQIPIGAVNVKGKTGEGVDAVGRNNAVDVHAVVLLVQNDTPSEGSVS